MAKLNDRVRDYGLDDLRTNANKLNLCSADPALDYTLANSTYILADATVTPGALANRTPDGRECEIPATSGNNVDTTGTASYWALVDTTNSRVYASGALASAVPVQSGNPFETSAFAVGYE